MLLKFVIYSQCVLLSMPKLKLGAVQSKQILPLRMFRLTSHKCCDSKYIKDFLAISFCIIINL